jgi:hypothetical protein
MTSGGHTMTEGWNLQLQGRVRDLEADLAEALGCIDTLSRGRLAPTARAFLKKMADKRTRATRIARDIDALLLQEGAPGSGRERKRLRPAKPTQWDGWVLVSAKTGRIMDASIAGRLDEAQCEFGPLAPGDRIEPATLTLKAEKRHGCLTSDTK